MSPGRKIYVAVGNANVNVNMSGVWCMQYGLHLGGICGTIIEKMLTYRIFCGFFLNTCLYKRSPPEIFAQNVPFLPFCIRECVFNTKYSFLSNTYYLRKLEKT